MRAQHSGHIIQISSVGGIFAVPTVGLYHASKWGLEGFSQALAAEVKDLGIKVTIIEPGGFATEWGTASAHRARQLPAYDAARAALGKIRTASVPGDPKATHPRCSESLMPPSPRCVCSSATQDCRWSRANMRSVSRLGKGGTTCRWKRKAISPIVADILAVNLYATRSVQEASMNFESRNPATGELLGVYQEHDKRETNVRLQRAWDGWRHWSRTSSTRANRLPHAAGQAAGGAGRDLWPPDHAEMGKPLAESIGEIKKCAWAARHLAETGEAYLKPQPSPAYRRRSSMNRWGRYSP